MYKVELRRSFQTVQGRVASSTEGGVASLAAIGLDLLGTAMFAIADEGVDLSIGDPVVHALQVGTSKALGLHVLGCAPAAFHLSPRTYRSRCWPSSQGGSGDETTSGAIVWRARLEQTVQCAARGPSR
jgi:hypothetical protein